MKSLDKSWGKELYYGSVKSVLKGIKNDRIREEVARRHLSCVPVRGTSTFVVRISNRGFIMNIYRTTEGMLAYPLYEAPRMPKPKEIYRMCIN